MCPGLLSLKSPSISGLIKGEIAFSSCFLILFTRPLHFFVAVHDPTLAVFFY